MVPALFSGELRASAPQLIREQSRQRFSGMERMP
tara:strand:+ start:465 stop:566 length:102 start_codon:yes stop_codon:yes gene_type:complete